MKAFLRPKSFAANLYVGLPLVVYENIYTGLHSGHPTTSIQTVALQTLLGFYTYGNDRFFDAIESGDYDLPERHEEKRLHYFSLNLALGLAVGIFISQEPYGLPFIPLLFSTRLYRGLKARLPLVKPFYLSLMWMISSYVMPSVLSYHDLGCLGDVSSYSPLFFNVFGSSTFLDIADLEKDRENGVQTIPVVCGKRVAAIVSYVSLLLSNVLLVTNEGFEERILCNAPFLLINVVFLGYVYNQLTRSTK